MITVGLLALLGREFNLIVVAALLTLVGYSVNDTVVVYDRMRENLKTPKKEPLESSSTARSTRPCRGRS